MATRFTTEFKDFIGQTYQIVIDDSSYAGGAVTYIAAGEGFEMHYETGGGAKLLEPIMASTVSLFMHIRPEYRADFEDFVADLVASGNENRFTVIIYRNTSLYWRGKVLAEQLVIPDKYYTEATLMASDGLGRLESIPYDDDGTLYEGWATYAEHIYNILSKLDLFDYPNTAASFAVVQNFVIKEEAGRMMEKLRVQHDAFKEIKSDGTILPLNCYDVLVQILTRFGLRIVQGSGVFYLQQITYLIGTENKATDIYDSDGTFSESVHSSYLYTRLVKLEGGKSWFRQPARSAAVGYAYKDSIQGSNLITGLIPVSTTYNLGEVPAGNGEVLGIGFDFKIKHTGNPLSLTVFFIQYIFTVQSGSYYLRNDGGVYEWTTDSSNRVRIIGDFNIEDAYTFEAIQGISFLCAELPSTGDVTISWTYARTNSLGVPVMPLGGTIVTNTDNRALIIYAVGDASEGTIVTTATSGNTTGEVIELPTLVHGDLPFLRSIGRMQFYDSNTMNWLNTADGWGFGTNEGLYIDELLTREAMALQKSNTEVRSYNLRSQIEADSKLSIDGCIITRLILQANSNITTVECFVPVIDRTGITFTDYTDSQQTGGLPNGIPSTPPVAVQQLWERDATTETLSPVYDDDNIEVNGMQLVTTPEVPAHSEGFLYWNDTDKCVNVMSGLNDSVLQVGQESWIRVRNNTGATIVNGKAVYITGRVGNRPTVALARADAKATSLVLGVTTEDIPNNSDGFVTINGAVRGVDMSAYTANDVLYLSATTAGAFTATSPARPNWVVKIGYVALNIVNGQLDVSLGIDFTNHVTINDLRVYNSLESTEAKIGNVSTGDYVNIDKSGHMTFKGAATVWDDVRVPVNDLTAAGANDPSQNNWLGNLRTWAFSASQMNELFFEVQIPHGYKEGSNIYPHVHWRPLSSAIPSTPQQRVRWGLEYVWQNVGQDAPVNTTTIYTTNLMPAENLVGFRHYISDFGAITGTGKTISSMLSCRIFRDATNAADDFTGLAGLIEIDFHIEMDSIGSNEEYTK